MGLKTAIEWCDATVNWWWGCTKLSEACRNCYAAVMDLRRGPLFDGGRVHWGPNAPRWVKTDSATKDARTVNRKSLKSGRRLRVFCNSMSDTFEDHHQLPAAREIMFAEIEKLTGTDFLLLTKRPENICKMVPAHWLEKWPAHVWVGTTLENKKELWRLDVLKAVPCHVRFLSCEPLLEDLGKIKLDGIHWVICGGESGSGARPMHPAWVNNLRDQCVAARVCFFFKQWGEFYPSAPIYSDLQDQRIGSSFEIQLENNGGIASSGEDVFYQPSPELDPWIMSRMPKKQSGRLLAGRTWDEVPQTPEVALYG